MCDNFRTNSCSTTRIEFTYYRDLTCTCYRGDVWYLIHFILIFSHFLSCFNYLFNLLHSVSTLSINFKIIFLLLYCFVKMMREVDLYVSWQWRNFYFSTHSRELYRVYYRSISRCCPGYRGINCEERMYLVIWYIGNWLVVQLYFIHFLYQCYHSLFR